MYPARANLAGNNFSEREKQCVYGGSERDKRHLSDCKLVNGQDECRLGAAWVHVDMSDYDKRSVQRLVLS